MPLPRIACHASLMREPAALQSFCRARPAACGARLWARLLEGSGADMQLLCGRYTSLPAFTVPKAAQGFKSCEMTMGRRNVHACHAGALVHSLEGWKHHEVRDKCDKAAAGTAHASVHWACGGCVADAGMV